MNRPRWTQGATSLQCFWRMGGRICDLPAPMLDRMAVVVATAPSRPVRIDRAQELMNARALDGDSVEVTHAS